MGLMEKLKRLLKQTSSSDYLATEGDDVVSEARNWYLERFATVQMQRNLLAFFLVVAVISMFLGILVIREVMLSKSIEPFVIEVEKKSGITTVVNPFTYSDLLADEALHKYFVLTYVRNRETYNPYTYQYNYFTVVRLLSSSPVYSNFIAFMRSEDGPLNKYSTDGINTTMRVRSLQFLDTDKKDPLTKVAQVRFTISENGQTTREYNKITTLTFQFVAMETNEEQREINPVGFIVTSYRVNDETL